MATYDGAAGWYDRVWGARRDYAADAAVIAGLVGERCPGARRLLDVGCATGGHLAQLRERFECVGVDVSSALLDIAADELGPGVELRRADMVSLDLGRTFDVITCMWGTIAYASTPHRLARTAERMAAHLDDGGLVVVEAWLTSDAFDDRGTVTVAVDQEAEPALTVVTASQRSGRIAELRRLYAAATPSGIRTVEEHHELGLFSAAEYRHAFTAAGFSVDWRPDGLRDRGLLIGVR